MDTGDALGAHMIVDGSELSSVMLDGERPRKLAVLGLPWETTEETFKAYFSQFGALEHAEIMKDRYTGKSRGFGFVTFSDPQTAAAALQTEHNIDGRRCEAKIALPKGEPAAPRTTRIFVARIPPSVTEAQFRQYFESFGKLQDAYMPKDHNKQGYRGIGFVTFASPDSVEKVMAVKHWMNGHEIAIDRATPKDDPTAVRSVYARLPLQNGRRSFDNGAGIISTGFNQIMNATASLMSQQSHAQQGHHHLPPATGPSGYPSGLRQLPLGSDSASAELAAIVTQGMDALADMPTQLNSYGNSMRNGNTQLMGLGGMASNPASAAAAAAAATAATTAALQTLHSLQSQGQAKSLTDTMTLGLGGLGLGSMGLSDLSAGLIANGVQQMMAAAAATAQATGRRSLDAHIKRLENPAIVTARAGPRIFVGKLTKDTTEADVKDYFGRFGYVMDVYMPKAKENKMEHRGFGFVTFETEAAIQRVVSHGAHRLKGSTIAIDIAMPKVDEESESSTHDHHGHSHGHGQHAGMHSYQALPHMLGQRM